MLQEVLIIEAVRTPVGRRNGLLSHIRPDELAALVLSELVRRAGIDPALVEDVIMGCVSQVGEQALCVGRLAVLMAGFPPHVPAVTIDRQCGSSQQAVHFAVQAIRCGDMDVVIAAGVESMSRVPMGSAMLDKGFSPRLTARYSIVPQGLSAEMVAAKWGLKREELDELAYSSHCKALAAAGAGVFKREIMPVEVELPDGRRTLVVRDEGPRADTSPAKLAGLRPVFKSDGVITAGNSSQISDGAAAVLLMSERRAVQLGLKPRARVVARAVYGDDPVIMLTAPIPASRMAMQKAGLGMGELDVYEINEAFASVPLAWLREMDGDVARLNPRGGAIALGHPLGASGARLLTTMLHYLEDTGKRYGLQAMCEGFGMANAMIVERL